MFDARRAADGGRHGGSLSGCRRRLTCLACVLQAKVVGTEPDKDLAVLRIARAGTAASVPLIPIAVGSSQALLVLHGSASTACPDCLSLCLR